MAKNDPLYLVILRANGSVVLQALDADDEPTLKQLQNIVGGYIETVPAKVGVLIVNEEGKLNKMPFNANATGMLRADVLDMIFGDAVLARVVGYKIKGVPMRMATMIADGLTGRQNRTNRRETKQ